DLAHGDGRCVTASFVSGGGEFCQRSVRGPGGVDSEYVGISRAESFDEWFRGERSTPGGAGFDACGLVDLVAEGGDFAATRREDPPDVERRAPVQPEP